MDNISCDLCRNLPEILGHILQRCLDTQSSRTRRHYRVLDFAVQSLERKGYRVIREPPTPTRAGMRYPYILAHHPTTGSWVIDVQVVADATAGNLYAAHHRKVTYYNVPDNSDFVVGETGCFPIYGSLTMSWRGVLAAPSVFLWDHLGLPKGDLKVLVTRALEGNGRIYREFTCTSGGLAHHP